MVFVQQKVTRIFYKSVLNCTIFTLWMRVSKAAMKPGEVLWRI